MWWNQGLQLELSGLSHSQTLSVAPYLVYIIITMVITVILLIIVIIIIIKTKNWLPQQRSVEEGGKNGEQTVTPAGVTYTNPPQWSAWYLAASASNAFQEASPLLPMSNWSSISSAGPPTGATCSRDPHCKSARSLGWTGFLGGNRSPAFNLCL